MKYTTLVPALLFGLSSAHYNWDIQRIGVVDKWPFSRSLPTDGGPLNGFTECGAIANFNATQYKVADLREPQPLGLQPWVDAVNNLLTSRFYPGSWDGVAYRGDERDIVLVPWGQVPAAARGWVEQQLRDPQASQSRFLTLVGKNGETGLGGVHDLPEGDVFLLAAPGELYHSWPLWVAEKSQCQAELLNLEKYAPGQAQDDSTVAELTVLTRPDRDNGKRDVSFKVEARHVRETEEGRAARVFWETTHRMAQRQHRKQIREERQAKRNLINRREKDEL